MPKTVREHLNFDSAQNGDLKAYYSTVGFHKIGEITDDFGKLHGKGIDLNGEWDIQIGYFRNNRLTFGSYVFICPDGSIKVGELTEDEFGEKSDKGTIYKEGGKSEKYGK